MSARSHCLFVVLLAAACGDDAPASADAAVDAPIDSAGTRIEVNVSRWNGSPAAGIDVVFHDEAGMPVVTTKTDAEGKTTIDDMPTVKMATVLAFDTEGQQRYLLTRTGIEPGDVLYYQLYYGATGASPFTAVLDVAYPDNPPAAANAYQFDLLCESITGGSVAFTHTMLNDCRRPKTNQIDAVVIARDGATELAFAVMPGITLASSGATAVRFPGGWRTDWANFDITYANSPAGATQLRSYFVLGVHGHYYYPFTSEVATITPGSTTMRSYQFANGIATSLSGSVEVNYGATMPRATAFYARGVAPGTATLDVDLSNKLLPPVTGITIEDNTTVRPRVTWTQDGTHEMAAAGGAYVNWSGAEPGSWSITFPPDLPATSITFPALPDELAAFRPPTDGSVGAGSKIVSFRWASYYPDYKASRQQNPNAFPVELYEEIETRYPGF